MPQLLTLFLFLPLISLASGQLANQQSDSSVGAPKLVDDEEVSNAIKLDDVEGISNGIRKSSDELLPISRGKRSQGVYCGYNTVDVDVEDIIRGWEGVDEFYQMKPFTSETLDLKFKSNWLGSYYFKITVAGREENEVEDQQTADAILSINYRDKVRRKPSFCPDFYLLLQTQSQTKTVFGPDF